MLKEKCYSEYQRRYDEYHAEHQKVDQLEQLVQQIQEEGATQLNKLEKQKHSALQAELAQKREYEQTLASVKKEGAASRAAQEFSRTKISEINSLEKDIQTLKATKVRAAQELEKKKANALNDLKRQQAACQKELAGLGAKIGGDGTSIRQFNEGELRQELKQKKAREIAHMTDTYDSSIHAAETALQNIDTDYDQRLNRELAFARNDASISGIHEQLSRKAAAKELPSIISAALERSVGYMVEKRNIKNGKMVCSMAREAEQLDDLGAYAPAWLEPLIRYGFPLLVGVLFFLLLSGFHLGFVAYATHTVVNFLVRVLCAAACFGVVFAIVSLVAGTVLGVVAGIIGGVIGFLFSAQIVVSVPDGAVNTVEWIIKLLICALIIALAFILIARNKNVLTRLSLKMGFIKNAALALQSTSIANHVDNYYVALRYPEIMEYVVQKEKQERTVSLQAELKELQSKKETSIQELTARLDQELEQAVKRARSAAENSRKTYEKEQLELIQRQDSLLLQSASFDGRVQQETEAYDKKIRTSNDSYDKKISDASARLQDLQKSITSDQDVLIRQLEQANQRTQDNYQKQQTEFDRQIASCQSQYASQVEKVQQEIAEYQKKFTPDFNAMYELLQKIYSRDLVQLEESGVLSDTLYIYNQKALTELDAKVSSCGGETGRLSPLKLYEIRHHKNPIVFLYESEDSSKIATNLYRFMDAVNIGFYVINCRDIFDLYITDPVSQGINFKDQEQKGRLKIVGDIKALYNIVSRSMDFVAAKGHSQSIDDLNRRLVAEGNEIEDINKFGRYNIVQFIVPEEESTQATDFFNNEIWTKFETSRKHGFLPIFYINKGEWDSALNTDEKFNSKFIQKLNKVLGANPENIYVIDWNEISLTKYEPSL